MFHNKKLTIFGHEIYCHDNYRFMTLPHKQFVNKLSISFNLPNQETEPIKANKYYYLEKLYYLEEITQSLINSQRYWIGFMSIHNVTMMK